MLLIALTPVRVEERLKSYDRMLLLNIFITDLKLINANLIN
jgi:hypothetical protein